MEKAIGATPAGMSNIVFDDALISFDVLVDDEKVLCELTEEALLEAAAVNYVVSREVAFERVGAAAVRAARMLARSVSHRPILLTGDALRLQMSSGGLRF